MKGTTETDPDRRQFLGMLGAGAVASVGISGTATELETPTVSMGNNYFDPIGLYVEPGTTVRFVIEAGSHSATAYEDRIPAGASPFDSGVLSEGGFEYTFDVPGTYDYYCIPHESTGMVGRIVVGDPGGPAEGSPIPSGDVPESETIAEQEAVAIDEFDGAGGDDGGGMMGTDPGTMNGNRPGWMMLVPVGFMAVILGALGGLVYWIARRGTTGSKPKDPAVATLEAQYARGEITEEEYEARKRRLQREG